MAGTIALTGIPHASAQQFDIPPDQRRLTAARAWVSLSELAAHTSFFASDALYGRAPGTQGGTTAAQYVAAQFERIGLLPGGPDGTYFQRIPMLGVTSSPVVTIETGMSSVSLNYPADFVARPERPIANLMAGGELTFVGYGVSSTEHDWDDFKSTTLTGRVLLVLPGAPPPLAGDGREGTVRYKIEKAVERGATGVLFVHSDSVVGLPWRVLRNRWTREFVWPLETQSTGLDFTGWITYSAAKQIFADAGIDWDVLSRRASLKEFRPVDVGAHAAVDIESSVRSFESSNVVGTIRGSEIPERTVLITAHYDYLGVQRGAYPDSIYNGARTNAAALSGLLTMASALSAAGVVAPTSFKFVAATAGESGAIGIQSFLWSLANTRESLHAAILIEEANLWGPTADIVVSGDPGIHEDPLVETAAAAEGMTPVPHKETHMPIPASLDTKNIFLATRVPFAALAAGSVLPANAPSARQQTIAAYYERHFGRVSDNLLSEFDFRGLQSQMRVAIRLAWGLAQIGAVPTN